MQHQSQMLNPPTNITTEQIQQCLDENKQLIVAIMENQNLGKITECASYQAKLQQNLMYLARIADAQPQATAAIQMPPQSAGQQEQYVQPSQAALSQRQPGSLSPKLPFQLNDQQQHQSPFLQQQQLIQGQMAMRPGAPSSIYQSMQTGNLMNIRGNKQDGIDVAAGDGMAKSSYGRSIGNTEG